MEFIVQPTEKDRREIIVNKLIAHNVYQRNNELLDQLPLTELEKQYKRFKSECHPHDGLGSLRITWKKK